MRPGPVSTDLGAPVLLEHGPELLATSDLILLLPGASYATAPPAPVLDALRAAHERGATVAAHCLGVFALAATGLLDDREVTLIGSTPTNWRPVFPGCGSARKPSTSTRATSSPVAASAGIDMCLHLIRRDHGAALANSIARILVTPPHRDGGQRQFIAAPLTTGDDGDRLAEVMAWARANLDRSVSLDELAGRALMSRRTFVRQFNAVTGATPYAWLLSQRLSLAQELLETTSLPVEQIAERVGYRSAAVFREQFTARRGLAPRDYRRTFSRTT